MPHNSASSEASNADLLYAVFTEASITYPYTLLGAASDVGLVALTQVSWEEFVTSGLRGPALAEAAARIADERVAVPDFFGNDQLRTILPQTYRSVKGSIATSVIELWQREPRQFESVSDPTVADW